MGSVQIYANYLQDPAHTIAQLHDAMALGATVTVPELFVVAGIHFSLNAETLNSVMKLVEAEIQELDSLLS